MGQQPLPQKWRLTCPSLSLSHFSSTGPATRVESSGEFIGFSLLLYMFHIRCIDNHTENSTSSRHSDHHSPSHRLFRPLPPTLSLLCLWRNKRTESRETQLTSWHTPARCSSPHPGKRKPLTGTHHTWPGCPPLPAAPLLLPRLTPLSAHLPPCGPRNGQHTSASGAVHFQPLGLYHSFRHVYSFFLPISAQECPHPAGLPGYLYVKQQTSPLPVWALFIFIRAQVTT